MVTPQIPWKVFSRLAHLADGSLVPDWLKEIGEGKLGRSKVNVSEELMKMAGF